MEKKLPKVFANKIEKKLNNNNTVFDSSKSDKTITSDHNPKISPTKVINIPKKISNLFNSSNYIYKINSKITLKDKIITKEIIGRNQKNLITIDSELIPIEEIVDIETV